MTGINWRQIDEPLFVRIVDAILDRIWGDRGVAPEGRGGDAGIDYRVDGTRIIYQYKFYPDGANTASRRRHIKASFADATKHNPEEWVLVVPARILPAMRAYVLGLSDRIKITIHDQPWLDNLLAKFGDLAEYFKYRTELDYLHAQAEMLKVNPVFRGPEDVDNKTAALKRAVDASDPDWTFDIAARAGEIVRTLVPKHPNAALRSPINIRYTALIPTDNPESRQFEIGHDYGFAEPFKLTGSMVRDFRITGPDLVAYEGAVGELEYHPGPGSPWRDTELLVSGTDGRHLGTHLAQSRFLASGEKGITIEVKIGDLVRMLFRCPNTEGGAGQVDFTTADFTGRPINEILTVSQFLAELGQGGDLDIDFGDQLRMKISISDIAADWPEVFEETRAIADDLSVIERETRTRFRHPATMTGLDRITIRGLRLMLEGHVVAHPTANSGNFTITGEPDAAFRELLDGQPRWFQWHVSQAEEAVLGKTIRLQQLAIGGPCFLDDASIQALQTAFATQSTEGLGITLRVDADDRLRTWLPDRVAPDKPLDVTPWDIPGIEQPGPRLDDPQRTAQKT
jgi:hypothetical protein